MKRLIQSSVVVATAAWVASVALAAPPPAASQSGPSDCELARASEHASVGKSPECRYLEKCCAGNTDNRQKCCDGYMKKCGKGE